MSSAEHSSNRWLPQLNEHLERERYSAKAAQRCVAVANAFLAFLKSRRIAVESADNTHTHRTVLAACFAAVPATPWTVTKVVRPIKAVLLVATLAHNCDQNASAARSWTAASGAQAQDQYRAVSS